MLQHSSALVHLHTCLKWPSWERLLTWISTDIAAAVEVDSRISCVNGLQQPADFPAHAVPSVHMPGHHHTKLLLVLQCLPTYTPPSLLLLPFPTPPTLVMKLAVVFRGMRCSSSAYQ